MEKSLAMLPDPNAGNYGPAMLALTDMMRAYVDAFLTQGDNNHTRAAISAGYANGPGSNIRAAAYRLAHDEKIIRAVVEETGRRIQSSVGMAASIILEVASDPMAKPEARLKAAAMLLNRGGLPEVTRKETTHLHMDLTMEQKINKLKALMREDPEIRALVPPDLVMDAEFTEVREHSMEGLEGIL